MAARKRPKGTAPRQARDTEQAFIQTATELFADQGYKGTSITDLAEPLGLTPASLYYYVPSKQDLLLRVLTSVLTGVLQRLEAVAQSDATSRDKLELAIRNHLDFVLGNPKAVAVFLRERRFLEPPYQEEYQGRIARYDALFTRIIEEGVDSGVFPAVNPSLARLAILGMTNWAVEWYQPGGRFSAAQVTEHMLQLVFHGITGPALALRVPPPVAPAGVPTGPGGSADDDREHQVRGVGPGVVDPVERRHEVGEAVVRHGSAGVRVAGETREVAAGDLQPDAVVDPEHVAGARQGHPDLVHHARQEQHGS